MCLVPQRSEEGTRFPEIEDKDSSKLPYECWDSNCVLFNSKWSLIAKPTPEPQVVLEVGFLKYLYVYANVCLLCVCTCVWLHEHMRLHESFLRKCYPWEDLPL